MSSSEYGIQIFLFVATIICYIVLFFCLMYGAYYCCLRSCILRHRRREEDGEHTDEVAENREYNYRYPYCNGSLLNPFRTEKDIPVHNDAPIHQNSDTVEESNSFVDKKYYDIFVA